MKLDIQSIHFDADQKLLEFIQKKCDKLETFFDRITHGEVFLRLEKNHENKRENKVVEIRLHIPGSTVFVSEQNISFEAATDSAVEALRSQLTKAKEKMKEH
jgi:putative sigma-54 modulation protein